MITAETLKAAGIPIENEDDKTMLMIESALEYISNNTTLKADVNNVDSLVKLPASAKLFITKYVEIMQRETGVTSESIAGMSQSFDSSSTDTLLFDLLNNLLGKYVSSGFQFIAATRKWK